MTLSLNSIGAHVTEKGIKDTVPVTARDAESVNGVKYVRRPFFAALLTLSMVPPNEPEETVPAVRTRTVCRHSVGGKMLVMPPLCRKYRFVKS
jgi:hypothetical protein